MRVKGGAVKCLHFGGMGIALLLDGADPEGGLHLSFSAPADCCAGELRTAIELIEASVQQLQDKDLLMSDYRGEPLDEVLQRFTESSDAAKDLVGALHGRLGTAYSAIGRVAYGEEPEEQESATGS
ncbi:hypothetical protein RFN58_00250 [Streptomyces iakyrus]|uniref:hypothetical protein n=1 Tax=Streptomyces iakyrus TaxID=68219 RepID=UPI000526B8CA|nr:hypothetical protein [Streptomyces iakyrus]